MSDEVATLQRALAELNANLQHKLHATAAIERDVERCARQGECDVTTLRKIETHVQSLRAFHYANTQLIFAVDGVVGALVNTRDGAEAPRHTAPASV